MTGTLINIVCVMIGGVLGLLMGNRFSERLRETIVSGLGIFTLLIGVKMFLDTGNVILTLGAILLGALLGEWWRIEQRLQSLGGWIEKKWSANKQAQNPERQNRFVNGFLTASLIFCVGPMTILGAIQDGLDGDFTLLAIKSVLDGFAALALASIFGEGVLFSILVIFFYQGGISLLAAQVNRFITPDMMNEMSATGGLILFSIGLSSLLQLKPIRSGNYLPALFIAPLLVWLFPLK